MTTLLDTMVSMTFLAAIIRTTTPLLFAALGGLLSDIVGSLNVALEGMMLLAAMVAVVTSVYAPWYIAVCCGLLSGAMLGGLMALFHLRFRADIILVGLAINIIAAGATVTVLAAVTGGDKGSTINLVSKALPTVDLALLAAIPVLGRGLEMILSGHSVLTWASVALVCCIWSFLYRMPQGLRFRAIGEYAAAAESAGLSANTYRAWGLVVSGMLAALGGVQLAMFNFIGFTRDMTAGRGFIALGAVLLGRRHPVGVLIATLLFGTFEALSVALPGIVAWIPGELVHAIPFLVTVVALILTSHSLSHK